MTSISSPFESNSPTALFAGNLSVDTEAYQVSVDGEEVELTYQEFELLRLLVLAAGHVLPQQAIEEHLWPTGDSDRFLRLRVAICRLRAKLASSDPYTIVTVRGRGYGLLARKRRVASA
ncbi:MAG: winged helix-turn-helix domain-containing protein [Dehalococcoidia bacterium]|jgi:DNA-binding response OmpR family regulator